MASLLAMSILAACAHRTPPPEAGLPPPPADSTAAGAPLFEPAPSALDTLAAAFPSPALVEPAPADSDTAAPPPGELVQGFRVQLFSSASCREALAFRSRLLLAGVRPAYVEYRSSLYRVRVGDCRDEAECLALQQRLSGEGFEGGVVHTLIWPTRRR